MRDIGATEGGGDRWRRWWRGWVLAVRGGVVALARRQSMAGLAMAAEAITEAVMAARDVEVRRRWSAGWKASCHQRAPREEKGDSAHLIRVAQEESSVLASPHWHLLAHGILGCPGPVRYGPRRRTEGAGDSPFERCT